MYLQQIWMLQALCYCSTCIYNRSVYQRLYFINAVYLPQVWAVHILCYYCTYTYNRSGCCRLCVNIVHVLTTGLGVAGFVLLLYMYLSLDWVLQALCYYCPCTYHRTGCCRLCVIIVHVLTTGLGVAGSAGTVHVVSVGVTDTAVAPIGWSWIVAESGSCLRAPSTRHTAGTPCVPATPVPAHWHNYKGRHRCSQGIIK